ncbi:hypothetical protein CR513_39771, partial [Mucuna pruriens]
MQPIQHNSLEDLIKKMAMSARVVDIVGADIARGANKLQAEQKERLMQDLKKLGDFYKHLVKHSTLRFLLKKPPKDMALLRWMRLPQATTDRSKANILDAKVQKFKCGEFDRIGRSRKTLWMHGTLRMQVVPLDALNVYGFSIWTMSSDYTPFKECTSWVSCLWTKTPRGNSRGLDEAWKPLDTKKTRVHIIEKATKSAYMSDECKHVRSGRGTQQSKGEICLVHTRKCRQQSWESKGTIKRPSRLVP